MAEDMGERTEMPTGKRLSEARSRGQIAKSTDLAAAIDLIGAVILIIALGAAGSAVLGAMTRRVLEGEATGAWTDVAGLKGLSMYVATEAGKILGPGLLIMLVIAALSQYVQVGNLITTETLKPNLARLNPIAGLKKFVGVRNLVRNGINVVKLVVVTVVASAVLWGHTQRLASLPTLELWAAIMIVLRLAAEMAAWLLALLLIIGLADLAFQRWQHLRDLRMTKHEVKDERRSMDGDPEIRGRRLRMARDIAMQRIGRDVPKADVIVTNPTHYSVALRYDAKTMRAPRVVAKGADELAFRIREVARAHGVPIVERPPLARALYHAVEPGREIHAEFYEAVAEVLAYVYRLERSAARPAPIPARTVAV